MKTLNKKNLKIINDLLYSCRSNDSHISLSEKRGGLSSEDEAFNRYLFWNTRLTSIELYEKYSICYFVEGYQTKLANEKERVSRNEKEAYNDLQEARRKNVA